MALKSHQYHKNKETTHILLVAVGRAGKAYVRKRKEREGKKTKNRTGAVSVTPHDLLPIGQTPKRRRDRREVGFSIFTHMPFRPLQPLLFFPYIGSLASPIRPSLPVPLFLSTSVPSTNTGDEHLFYPITSKCPEQI